VLDSILVCYVVITDSMKLKKIMRLLCPTLEKSSYKILWKSIEWIKT